jgi:hypothetical protein
MPTFVLKLVLTPTLIGGATLAGRRWGPAVAGWLVGLPLTSAPVALFLAIDHGRVFAAMAATGMLAGTVSQAVFSLAYSRVAGKGPWLSVALGCLGFAWSTLLLDRLSLAVLPALAITLAAILAALWLLPVKSVGPEPSSPLSRWEIVIRMLVATTFVLALTASAPVLGPRLSGLLSPFPFFGALLAAFAHHNAGAASAVAVLGGLLHGLFAPVAFFLVLSGLLVPLGIPAAFAVAAAAGIATQGLTLWALRH